MNFDDRPFLVIWEVTRACRLACRHCRASAQCQPHPGELTPSEALLAVDQVAAAHPELFVLTGGDPVLRPDLLDIISAASAQNLRVALSPSATPDLLACNFDTLREAGVARMSLSLDGASRETHDRFRGVPGVWDWTQEAIRKANAAHLPIQINTTFTRQNLNEFDAFVRCLSEINPILWSVFQLVPTGRGKTDDLLTADEMEDLFVRLANLRGEVPFDIKTTEGPHYRRVVVQKGGGISSLRARAPLGINDGKGFVFLSHTGDIYPSGFLPMPTGNIRTRNLLDTYRTHPVFTALRDSNNLKGKCGRCEFRNLCGGSRARAFAMTGDIFAAEPLCCYQPPLESGHLSQDLPRLRQERVGAPEAAVLR